MIYPEGKPNSVMTQEKLEQLEVRNRDLVEQAKGKMGVKFLFHPENQVKKISKPRMNKVI